MAGRGLGRDAERWDVCLASWDFRNVAMERKHTMVNDGYIMMVNKGNIWLMNCL